MQENRFRRYIELLIKVLYRRSYDNNDNKFDVELLIVKPERRLSRSRAALITEQGYKFCHCYYEQVNDRPVIVFLKR
jgi:hypothetical protein